MPEKPLRNYVIFDVRSKRIVSQGYRRPEQARREIENSGRQIVLTERWALEIIAQNKQQEQSKQQN